MKTYTQTKLQAILENHKDWIKSNGLKGKPAYLNEIDLHERDFSGVCLESASFIGANLKGANFQKANLKGAALGETNLEGANLQGANLQRADLEETNFEGANLAKANLKGICSKKANFSRANLMETNLSGGCFLRANFKKTNFSGANLEKAGFVFANFIGAFGLTIPKAGNIYKLIPSEEEGIFLKNEYDDFYDFEKGETGLILGIHGTQNENHLAQHKQGDFDLMFLSGNRKGEIWKRIEWRHLLTHIGKEVIKIK